MIDRLRSKKGITLIETLFATALFAFVMLGFWYALRFSSQSV
ncbi:MAG: prepilin-type N-terminal cleavage/methylation domain-containing protein [Candidatus Riflebacteria bacterium]|nr:prepilin-type N-terminal cleavage/methylation domain-containing protein [Candidatus Riflebacteria bacterium]